MKFLFDVFPVILFFVTFKWAENHVPAAQAYVDQYLSGLVSGGVSAPAIAPIMLATAVTLLASIAQIAYLLIRRIKVEAMLWISFLTVMVFGSATIYFNSETFIKWKPTVLYWCYAAAFALGHFVFNKNLIRTAMEAQVSLPDSIWNKLSLAWIGYFLAMGCLNLFVAYQFSTDTWANFKLASLILIMPAFLIAQSFYLSKYMQEPKNDA